MDTLTVSTCADAAHNGFVTSWKWKRDNSPTAKQAGRIIVVPATTKFTEDQIVLAELVALSHLLSVIEIQGEGRLGTGLAIEVSSGAIKKAVAKGSIKKGDAGRTEKLHVALFSQFLATKFFEADVSVQPASKWALDLDAFPDVTTIELVDPPSAKIDSTQGPVVVSRHGLNRFVERFVAADQIKGGASLADVPNKRWSRAWKVLETILPAAVQVSVPKSEWSRIVSKYGSGTVVLHHPDSQNIFVLKREAYGYVLATVLRDSDYARIIPKLPTFAGGRLIQHRR